MNGITKYKKVILLGMDGLDPKIVSDLMERGELPNFKALSESGSFTALDTSNLAQSPVAWASIATGMNPGHHGVFDFLGRRITDYMPELAVYRINRKNIFGKRESMFLPVMHGNTFWDYISDNNIPSTILKWPMTFQPKQNNAKLFAGLGVPDIKGGLGRYSFYTTKEISVSEEGAEKVVRVKFNGDTLKTDISGPNVAKMRGREEAKVNMNIKVLPDKSGAELDVDGKKISVRTGEWSEWVEVKFKLGMMKTTSGTIKFYLNEINPDLELYMTPVQINPNDPAFVITSPDEYIQELSREIGLFYTIGMPEDTKAFEEGRTDEEAFISMCDEVIEEQEKMLWYELDRFKEGLLASAFFSTDRVQHMFWATRDKLHPLYESEYAEKYGHVIDDYYRKMDSILGKVMERVDDKTAVMVFSDHGFSTFRRAVHLNSWLVDNGYMKLTKKITADDKDGGGLFKFVDWKNTKAYALGFGGIYLNIKGRERNGIVEKGEGADLVAEGIIKGLSELKDSSNGQSAVKKVYSSKDIYSGPNVGNAPDLLVGFQDGYRVSWQTAIGGAPAELMEDNTKKWSGDHIIDPSLVPGILLTNFKIGRDKPSLMDIAPSVLDCFGMSVSDMEGQTLL
jgi:predicted AlkP superfamily phosphohydrolase/phosphomutase